MAVWRVDLKDPLNPRKLETSVPSWTQLALARDGRIAVFAGVDNSLWYWDLQTGEPRLLVPRGKAAVTAIALSPDNQLVAYIRDGAIQFCETIQNAIGKKKELSRRIGDGTALIAFSPDGRRIVSSHADRSIRAWDVKTRRIVGDVVTQKSATAIAVFPDGRRVLAAYPGQDPTIEIWDIETRSRLLRTPIFGDSVAISSDGRRALIGSGNYMRLWDMLTGEQLVLEDYKKAVLHTTFSTDDHYAACSTDDSVHVWSVGPAPPAGAQLPLVEVLQFPVHDRLINALVISPDGRRVLTGGQGSTIRLWDLDTRQSRNFDSEIPEIRSLAFSPDGKLALCGGDDAVVRLLDLESGERRELRGHKEFVMSVVFSPRSKRAYAAGGMVWRDARLSDATDFAVRVWDLENGDQRQHLEGHKGAVRSLAVSSDGRYVLSGGNDATPILWDTNTGGETLVPRSHRGGRMRGLRTRRPARDLFGLGRHNPPLGS